jgi:enterochelin esterase-like enzyme
MKIRLMVFIALSAAIACASGAAPAQDEAARQSNKEARQAARDAAQQKSADDSGDASASQDRGNWVDPNKEEPSGTQYKTFHSRTIDGDVSYLVYLPPNYESDAQRRYPVIYWLHGGGGNQRTGDYFVEKMGEAMQAGKTPEAILILVNGVGGSLFSDSIDGSKPVETVIVRDLIPHVDATYRTFGMRKMRAVEGFSMGGFGALHLTFKFPDLFGSITALAHAPIRPDSGWPKVDRVWKTGP